MAIGSSTSINQKKRQASSKGNGKVIGLNNASISSLLDYSNRNSNKNIKAGINPYLFEINSSKKISKKKSESLDIVSFYSKDSCSKASEAEARTCGTLRISRNPWLSKRKCQVIQSRQSSTTL